MGTRRLDAITANLMLVDWQVFGTLTWRSSRLGSARSRECDVWEFLRNMSEGNRSVDRFALMPVVVRWERGEAGGRPHAHFLMAGLTKVTVDWLYRQTTKWFVAHGLARLRLTFNGSIRADCVSYAAKHTAVSGKDRYEVGKFSGADRLVINEAAWAVISRRSGVRVSPQHRTV